MLYDLRHADPRLKWLVTCLLATFGLAYLFGAWMVQRYAGFGPRQVAQTYAGAPMHMPMPPDTTVVIEHPLSIGQMAAEDHHAVDLDLLVQDTHVHVPMYGVIATLLSLVVLGLSLPRNAGFALITLLFAAPWLDFAGMWLVKLVSPAFAIVTVAGGWAMGAGYAMVTVIAVRQMWFRRPGGA